MSELLSAPLFAQAPGVAPPDRDPALAQLASDCQACRRCSLGASRLNVVVSRGNPRARLMVIGEGPGAQEDELGQPFVGRSGQLLDLMLESVGIHSNRDAYVCNIVKCRPPENRKPTALEMAACRPWLDQQIALVDPQVILLAGATAVEGLLGIKGGITKLRGQWLHLETSQGPDQPTPSQPAQRQQAPSQPLQNQRKPSPRSPLRWPPGGAAGIALMPLLHPSYLLRHPSEAEGSPRWLTRADLVAVRDRLEDDMDLKTPRPGMEIQ